MREVKHLISVTGLLVPELLSLITMRTRGRGCFFNIYVQEMFILFFIFSNMVLFLNYSKVIIDIILASTGRRVANRNMT